MRRRRKFKGTWLPNIGIVQTDPTLAPTAGREMEITIGAGTSITGGVLPLIFDTPQEGDELVADVPLSYLAANEYSLRRIVGKAEIFTYGQIHTTSTSNLDGQPPFILVTSGLFIARAGDASQGVANEDAPIAWGNEGAFSYNPDIPNAIREPWIWRRQWLLANAVVKQMVWQNMTVIPSSGYVASTLDAPASTMEFGSVLDGPHLDAKTRRRVGNDDRLFWTVFAQPYPRRGAGYNQDSFVHARLDYRVFGALRKARNRGNF